MDKQLRVKWERTKKDRCCGNQGRWISERGWSEAQTHRKTRMNSVMTLDGMLSKTGNKSRLQKVGDRQAGMV